MRGNTVIACPCASACHPGCSDGGYRRCGQPGHPAARCAGAGDGAERAHVVFDKTELRLWASRPQLSESNRIVATRQRCSGGPPAPFCPASIRWRGPWSERQRTASAPSVQPRFERYPAWITGRVGEEELSSATGGHAKTRIDLGDWTERARGWQPTVHADRVARQGARRIPRHRRPIRSAPPRLSPTRQRGSNVFEWRQRQAAAGGPAAGMERVLARYCRATRLANRAPRDRASRMVGDG